ncbi:MAG: DUF4255 domain-containing protein [Thermoplasmata archaeon]|nr:MAG: DUF4255 domain-containing protein [Thermoplasmata archaeon]
MGNYEAIAKTSITLKKLLESQMKTENVIATIGYPENASNNRNQINLFLFQVMENKHLKNDESKLWLDLYYLVTPFDKEETQKQALLGDAMRVFHDNSIINLDTAYGSEKKYSKQKSKDSQEKIRITPHHMSFEELCKIWHSLKEVFSLSVAYQVSVLQIDSEEDNRFIESDRQLVKRDFEMASRNSPKPNLKYRKRK